ncbi:MAG: NAD(+) synthase, partial [Bacilli bacterium]
MKLADYLLEIQAFIQDYLKKSHQKGYVLGISGGIDSALVAALTTKAVGRDKLFALLMPIDSEKCDVEYGLELCHKFAIPYEVVDLSEPYHQLIAKFDLEDSSAKAIALNNTKVRLRMVTLYAYAQ